MSVALQTGWTRETFFAFAEAQETRYEFDGVAPVAMTGGSVNHNTICMNIHAALRQRLRAPCRVFGLDAAIATPGQAVRYPDAVVTCAQVDGTSRLLPPPLCLFEVSSPSSGSTDRIIKLREYQQIASVRSYVIVEHAGAGVLHLHRAHSGDWTAVSLTGQDVLVLPELGVELPVASFYEDVVFGAP